VTTEKIIEVDLDGDEFNSHERIVLAAITDEVGNDVPRILDALHHLAAKLAYLGEITTDSLLAGQARHSGLLVGRN